MLLNVILFIVIFKFIQQTDYEFAAIDLITEIKNVFVIHIFDNFIFHFYLIELKFQVQDLLDDNKWYQKYRKAQQKPRNDHKYQA